jgi:hypothetical protein
VNNANSSNTFCRTLKLGNTIVENPNIAVQILASPNPFTNRINVTLSANMHDPVFRLFDPMGRLVLEEYLAIGVTEVETSALPSGLYFWEIRSIGELAKSGKIIKIEH